MLLFFASLPPLYAPNAFAVVILPEPIENPFMKLWMPVKMVESANNPLALNIDEGAYGCSQITLVKLIDFNKATGKNYTQQDCFREDISLEIFLWHCQSYSNFEQAARRWNGSGKATIEYWRKVSIYLADV